MTQYIVFNAEVNPNTINNLRNVITNAVNAGNDHLYILISSPGGNVVDGLNIAAYIKALSAKVTMHNVNQIDSVANVIFAAGDERFATSNASFLYHGVMMNYVNAHFTEEQLNEQYKIAIRLREDIARNYATYVGMPLHDVEKLMKRSASIIGAANAKTKGIIHDVKDANIPAHSQIITIGN